MRMQASRRRQSASANQRRRAGLLPLYPVTIRANAQSAVTLDPNKRPDAPARGFARAVAHDSFMALTSWAGPEPVRGGGQGSTQRLERVDRASGGGRTGPRRRVCPKGTTGWKVDSSLRDEPISVSPTRTKCNEDPPCRTTPPGFASGRQPALESWASAPAETWYVPTAQAEQRVEEVPPGARCRWAQREKRR